MKKYLSGAVLLVLISSASATAEEASFLNKTKDFYNENKTAVIAGATGLTTTVVATVIAGLGWYKANNAKKNTLVGLSDVSEVPKKESDKIEKVASNLVEIEKLKNENKAADVTADETKKKNDRIELLEEQVKLLVAGSIVAERVEAINAKLNPAPKADDKKADAPASKEEGKASEENTSKENTSKENTSKENTSEGKTSEGKTSEGKTSEEDTTSKGTTSEENTSKEGTAPVDNTEVK